MSLTVNNRSNKNQKPQDKLLWQARLARRTLRRAAQMIRFRRWSLDEVPVLFANSFPKSGTHLLTQVLQGFSQLGPAVDSGLPAITTFEGDTGRSRASSEIVKDLHRLRPGDIAYGHIHALPEVITFLGQDGVAPYFILRDPRDVVVSHVHYVSEIETNHIHHQYYTEVLQDFEERLHTSILGIPNPEIPFPDIRTRFEPYLLWLEQSSVLSLHYEEFVTAREQAIGCVLDHSIRRGFPTKIEREKAIQVLSKNIDPKRSPTFRSGKIGGWKDQFSEKNKRLFKEVTGDMLIRLGYERDYDW